MLRKFCFSDAMFFYFWSKGDKGLKATRMYRFEAKGNLKTLKDVKLNVLQNGYLKLYLFSVLTPQIQNFD